MLGAVVNGRDTTRAMTETTRAVGAGTLMPEDVTAAPALQESHCLSGAPTAGTPGIAVANSLAATE